MGDAILARARAAAESIKAREARNADARKLALRLVADGAIEWRADIGLDGGFVRVAPTGCATDIELLIALYELRHHQLIVADGQRVCVTLAGRARLSGWNGGLSRG